MPASGGVVQYLFEIGLLQSESVVGSDVVVLDASGRNRNHKVIRRHGSSYLLKQGAGQDGHVTVAHEAAVYRFLGSLPARRGLNSFLPRFLRYEPSERILVLELVRDAEALGEHHARVGRVPSRVAGEMGRALGTLHFATHRSRADLGWLGIGHADPPWVLSIHLPNWRLLRQASSANVHLVRIVQEFPEFSAHLDRLRDSWIPECVTHNDLKAANCIVSRARTSAPSFRRAPALKIVDWELAGIGDPSWDVGSIFCDYLALWLQSAPIAGDIEPERFLKLTRFPLDRMYPAMRAFWRAYVRHAQIDPSAEQALLLRSVLCAGARLVQTTYESMQFSAGLTGNAICLLQLSWNMMSRPHDAAARLLGFPAELSRSA